MEKDLPQPSNFDVYLSSSDFKRRLEDFKRKHGDARITSIDKSEEESFLRIGIDDNATHEVFLTYNGEPIASRTMVVWGDGFRYQTVHIDGNENNLEYSIDRLIVGRMDESTWIDEGFVIKFELIDQALDRTMAYELMYGAYHDFGIVFSPEKEAKKTDRTRVGFDGVMDTVATDEADDERTLDDTDSNGAVFNFQTNTSFRLEKEKISKQVYEFRIFTKDLGSGKESVVAFPSEIDVQEWDKKIRTPDRSWRNLGKEMPITLQTIS